MEDERTLASSGFVVTPETIAGRTFTTGFRGFDQGEVRTFLKRVSEELGGAAEREAQLRRMLHEAQNKAAHPEVDEELLTNALGEHAARLLATAREQAAVIRSEAEARASRLMRDVEGQISRIRADADGLLARRVEEVDGVTANLRNAAEADARDLREHAKADAEAEVQAARNQGREMVAEARAVRERILADLARRRHVSEVQLDQLRAARERLLSAYSLVRRTLDEATAELKKAEMEARMAADEVGRRAPAPPSAPPPASQFGSTGVLDTDPGSRRHEPWPIAAPAASTSPLGSAPQPAPVPAAAAAGTSASGTSASAAGGSAARPSVGAPMARATRTEPGARSEPRLRPPARPGEARPSSPPPRRPSDVESPPWSPPRRNERDAGVPAPATAHAQRPAPSSAPVGRQLPPEPPSILPRPVSPPPPRDIRRSMPEADPAAHRPGGPAHQGGPTGLVPPSPATPASPAARGPSLAPTRQPLPIAGDPRVPESDRVDELFARIKADRAGVVVASMPAPAPGVAPPSPVADSGGPPGTPDTADAKIGDSGPQPVFTDERRPAADDPAPAQTIADESARARRDELLEPIEEALVRQLKRVLQDEQNEVLDRLRRKRRRRSSPALPGPEEQVGRFREVAESILGDAVRAGVRFGSPAASEAHADEHAARTVAEALAREIAEPLRQRLDRCFADSADSADDGADGRNGDADRAEDEGVELSDRVSAVYRQWRAQELEPLARHHAVTAFGLGAFAAYGEGTLLRWVVDDDGGPCPDCDDNTLAGAVTKGQPYPTGQVHPPAHPGCRCILVPTVP